MLVVESLPSLTKDLANLTCGCACKSAWFNRVSEMERGHTEGDARVLFTDILALLVGEEHVCGKTTLGGVGICDGESAMAPASSRLGRRHTLLFLLRAGLDSALGGLFLGHVDGLLGF